MLYYNIDLGYACFGIVVKDGRVIEACDSIRWAVGKDAKFVLDYYRKAKGAKITIMDK